MLSNSYTPFILELYAGFRIELVQASRGVNSDANGRGMINELIDMPDVFASKPSAFFSDSVIEHKQAVANRRYTTGMRPAKSHLWQNLHLVTYRFDPVEQRLYFQKISGLD